VRLEDLVDALLCHDQLAARQWVADAGREKFEWRNVPVPSGLDAIGLAVGAGVAELLASRAGQTPPDWTAAVPALPEPFLLVEAAARMPRLRQLCELEGPEPLRKRRLLAPPEFLTAA
jgi:hypothetical protein